MKIYTSKTLNVQDEVLKLFSHSKSFFLTLNFWRRKFTTSWIQTTQLFFFKVKLGQTQSKWCLCWEIDSEWQFENAFREENYWYNWRGNSPFEDFMIFSWKSSRFAMLWSNLKSGAGTKESDLVSGKTKRPNFDASFRMDDSSDDTAFFHPDIMPWNFQKQMKVETGKKQRKKQTKNKSSSKIFWHIGGYLLQTFFLCLIFPWCFPLKLWDGWMTCSFYTILNKWLNLLSLAASYIHLQLFEAFENFESISHLKYFLSLGFSSLRRKLQKWIFTKISW